MKRKPSSDPRATTSTDKKIGENLRRIRNERDVSQESLAEALGVTFQQVQKYEWGVNRVSASRLFDISKALKTPVAQFYEGA